MQIKLQNLCKVYDLQNKKLIVLNKLNCQFESGGMYVITGISGSGKSTLIHILGTLDFPSNGKVLWDNCDIFSLKESEIAEFRNRNIGFVFQFHQLLPDLNALENVQLPLLIQRTNLKIAKEKALDLLLRIGLNERLYHKSRELSGGEQQRVALARALITKPKLLLADEPTGNLDQDAELSILRIMEEFNAKFGTTIIIVTHNANLFIENRYKQLPVCNLE